MWQIETYDTKTKTWLPMGAAAADFHGIWKKVGRMSANGYKVRIKKQPDKAPETPEQKMSAGETPECTFREPYACEFCSAECQIEPDNRRGTKE